MFLGYTQKEAVISSFQDLNLINKKQTQILRNAKISNKCINGKNHNFDSYDGKCYNCNILGCAAGLINHKFDNYDGKCNFCNILGCTIGLINHKFDNYDGKCNYCDLMGCEAGFINHKFNEYDGKCEFCGLFMLSGWN